MMKTEKNRTLWEVASRTDILRLQIVKPVGISKNSRKNSFLEFFSYICHMEKFVFKENSDKSKIIFLDIDGVLNSDVFFVEKRGKGDASMLDKDAVVLLNQLRGAKIVVSSSWGENGGKTTEDLIKAGLELPIIGYTKKVHYQFEWACRGNEIEEWLKRTYGGMGTMYGSCYDDDDYDYVILDDDRDMLLGQIDHFIYVNRQTGLTQDDIDKAKKILNL